MTKCEVSRICVRWGSFYLLTVTLFILGIGFALLHPSWVWAAISKEKPVTLDVTVVDATGRPLAGLTQEEFTVYEDGVKQKITIFNDEEIPVSLGILIDASGSTKAVAHSYREVALKIIGQLVPEDVAFLIQFKAEPEMIQEFTNIRQELETAVDPISTGGGTAIFDAIAAASEYIQLKGKSRRKALVIVTDGEDKNSSIEDEELLKRLIEDQPQLYFICLNPTVKSVVPEKAKVILNRLNRLAQATGGQFYPTTTTDEAVKIAAQIMENLHHQYELSYVPTTTKPDDVLRKLSVIVTLKDGREIKATTRESRYGPGYKILR
jgi:Ca-activated chloride channel homolog